MWPWLLPYTRPAGEPASALEALVISSAADLCEIGLHSELRPLLLSGDWYLVGSRSTGDADALSDWDSILITDTEDAETPSQSVLDAVFGISRPALHGRPNLDFHVAWRSVAAVDLEVVTPDLASRRAEDLSTWAYELTHAQLLHRGTGTGEDYRGAITDRFVAACPTLAQQAYDSYRLARNQAVSALARQDAAVQVMLGGQCAVAAARAWFLAAGQPAPGPKWLLPTLDRSPGGSHLADLLRTVLGSKPPGTTQDRFDALLAVWDVLDRHVDQVGLATN